MQKILWPVVAVAMIVMSTYFVSCNRESETERSAVSSISHSKAAEYPANPYDFVGQRHNQFLNYLAATTNVGKLTTLDIFMASNEFSQTFLGQQDTLDLNETIVHLEGTENYVNNLLHKNGSYGIFLSNPLLISIMDEFTHALRLMMSDSSLMLPDVFFSFINNLENQVLAEGMHTNPKEDIINEHAQVLSALAIARYSYDYWYDVISDSSNPWHYYVNNGTKETNCRIWRFICDVAHTVKADVVGFFGDTTTPADPQEPEKGGTSTSISCSRAGKASAYEWEQCKNVEYDEEGNRYFLS